MSQNLRNASFTVVLFLIAFFIVRTDIDSYKHFDVDEPSWISVSSHTFDWILKGDFSQKTWLADEFHVFGNPNPPLGKYLIGGSLKFFGNTAPVNYPWDWTKTKEENIDEIR